MKEILVAEHSGFCFGVKRAIEKTEEQLDKEGKVLICGSLIHNNSVTGDIVSRGGRIIHSLDEAKEGDTVIVRSHGEGEKFYLDAEERGIKLIDATCPFVERIHKLVRKADLEGHNIVIVGDRDHAEVKGISGWCSKAVIVDSAEEAAQIKEDDLFIVCHLDFRGQIKIIQYISRLVVFEDNNPPGAVRKACHTGKILIRFADGDGGIGVN